MSLDPITIEVIASRFGEIAATMEYILYHSGYSPILRESKDGTAGLTDRDGRVVLIGGGLQYHIIAYHRSVQAVLSRYACSSLKPGDSFILNDPYIAGNAHAPDMVAVTPAFFGGELIGFGVSVAHKADIGGIVPGSSGSTAREIYHDGLLLPPVRFQTAAGIEEGIEAILRNNSRIPDVLIGDLRAQVGATRIGVERLATLCSEFGCDTVQAVMDRLMQLTRRRATDEIASWPDGQAEANGFLDHDGANIDRPVEIRVVATKAGERIQLDFSGSSPQTLGPVNLTTPTAQAVSLQALHTMVDPTIPFNQGLRDVIDFLVPEGLVVSPVHPATVNHYFPTACVTYSCVLSALGKLNPARAVAQAGLGCGALVIGYRKSRTGKPAVLYELLMTSLGGTSYQDGVAMVSTMNHMTSGAPIEILETEYPVRVTRFDIWKDSAGPGQYRGGIGHIREFQVLEDSVLSVRSTNHRFAAQGLNGGYSPKTSGVVINPNSSDGKELGPIETQQLKAGDIIRFERSGGAGYGPPKQRSREEVLDDVRNGYTSPGAAAMIYGHPIHASEIKKCDSQGE